MIFVVFVLHKHRRAVAMFSRKKECVTVLWLATLSIYNNHIQSLLWEITDGFHLTARFPF